ncbi:flavodoxin [Biostraticola tofi]|uniref:Flavodoxin n=1 Tax=Biostraticola tofi TaxID=466109 RepID=A0A4R3YNX1_9GAMM|nr:flavodoxin [Biostraticola tofi]TCV92593.1 flavodoxin [Biostraticola tofi]
MAQIGIFIGTVYGNALMVGEEAETILKEQGHDVTLFEDPHLADWLLFSEHYALVITSTTGQGNLPDNIVPLYEGIKEKVGHQPALHYGVIALGDSSYDYFCGAGQRFDALLKEQGASRVGEVLQIDAMEHPEPEVVACPWLEQWAQLIKA